MAADPQNPFGLPGFNASILGGSANPLAASLDMMQRALSSFGQSATMAGGSVAQTLNPEELEKKIAELRAVENWLKLNLSLLGSSIQGMEVQLATIKTLRSFVAMGEQTQQDDTRPASPLEVVLGLRKPNETAQTDTVASAPTAPPAHDAEMPGAHNMNAQAATAWWEMLQGQFAQLAQATAQSAPFSASIIKPVSEPTAPGSAHKAVKRSAKKSTRTKTSTTKNTKPMRD